MANADPEPTAPPPSEPPVASGPALAVVLAAAAVTVTAWVLGWYAAETLFAALGMAVAVVALVVLHRRTRDRQLAYQSLKDVEARVSGIVESAMDPVITVDSEQRIVLFNAAAEHAFRWPRAAVVGQPLCTLLPERFRSQHASHIERFARTGVTSRRMGVQTALRALRADGTEFPIEASISQHREDQQAFFTVILRDITERADAEALLARSEARLRGMVDAAMDAIVTIDENQHIVLFNAAAETMFACPQDQAIGAPLVWFIPDRFRGVHAEHVRQFGTTGTTSRRMGATRIVTGLRRNGEEFPIDASISQLNEHGSKFYTVILRDVSERVRAEDALRRSKEELENLAIAAHMAREQEKSRIARELHDELAQSLSGLKMEVAWIAQRLPEGDSAVGRKLERVALLLDQTVAATRRIAADLRPLILDDLGLVPAVEWLVQNFSEQSGVPCELTVDDPDVALENTQATAVFRIVQESLANVAKHARASRAVVAIAHDTGSITFSVRDDGVGFSPAAARPPNSLGLVGVRERTQLLNGDVSIVSAPGQGTTIRVRLPLES